MERKDNSLFSQKRDLPGIDIAPCPGPFQLCLICGNICITFLLLFLQEIDPSCYGKGFLCVCFFLNHTLGGFIRRCGHSFFQGSDLFLELHKARPFSLFDLNMQKSKLPQLFQRIFPLAVKYDQGNFFHRHDHGTATSLPAAAAFACAIFFLEILERTTALTC